MSATATINGKPQQRKQLTDQLDRLDSIIDLLAEGLPGAVADACRDGARAAVRDAVIEIITNPELRAMLAPHSIPATTMPMAPVEATSATSVSKERKPSIWSRFKAKIAAAKNAVSGSVLKVKTAIVDRCHAVRNAVAALGHASGESVPVREISVVAVGVGMVVGLSCLLIPHEIAAVVGGVGAASTAFAMQIGSWLKRAARRVGLFG